MKYEIESNRKDTSQCENTHLNGRQLKNYAGKKLNA